MAELTPDCWCGSRAEVALALTGARSVQTWADPHIETRLPASVIQHAPPSLFARIERSRSSFSKWWIDVTHGAKSLHDLPGLAAWVSQEAPGPLFAQSAQT